MDQAPDLYQPPFSFQPINPGLSLCYCLVVFTRRKRERTPLCFLWRAFACSPQTQHFFFLPIVYLIWQLTQLGSVYCLGSGTRKYLVPGSLQTFELDIYIIATNELFFTIQDLYCLKHVAKPIIVRI